MTTLGLAVGASAIYAHIYKSASRQAVDIRSLNMLTFAAGAVMVAVLWRQWGLNVSLMPVVLGMVAGASNMISAVTFFRVVAYGSLATSWTVISLAIIFPVVLGALFWGEWPNGPKQLGLVLSIIAIVLIGNSESTRIANPLLWAGWLTVSYIASGIGLTTFKILSLSDYADSQNLFLLVNYIVAVLLSGIARKERLRPDRRSIGLGLLRGASLVTKNVFLLRAAEILPSYVVFPAYGVGNVMLTTATSAVLWRERLSVRGVVGIGVALISIAVLSLA